MVLQKCAFYIFNVNVCIVCHTYLHIHTIYLALTKVTWYTDIISNAIRKCFPVSSWALFSVSINWMWLALLPLFSFKLRAICKLYAGISSSPPGGCCRQPESYVNVLLHGIWGSAIGNPSAVNIWQPLFMGLIRANVIVEGLPSIARTERY